MVLTELEKRTATMLAEHYHQLSPLIEQLAEMGLPDLDTLRLDLAASGLRGLGLANLLVQLDEAIEDAYTKFMAISAELRKNDLIAVAMGTTPATWEIDLR